MAFNEVQNSDGSTSFVDAATSRDALRLYSDRGLDPGISTYCRWIDDFVGDLIADEWTPLAGIDSPAAAPAILTSGNCGIIAFTTGDAGDTFANDSSQLSSHLNWKASNGGLFVEARLKCVSSVANIGLNFGFTDTSALEMPITLSGTTLTTNASDAAVFVFDTAADTDVLNIQGVKANSDTALLAATGALAPTADTWFTLGVGIDSSGTASFYYNRAFVGQVANAVTTSVALTPTIGYVTRTTASKVLYCDYVIVSQLRA